MYNENDVKKTKHSEEEDSTFYSALILMVILQLCVIRFLQDFPQRSFILI